MPSDPPVTAPRYRIGIDLGTTNCAVASIDMAEATADPPAIRVFPVPQLVAEGEVQPRPTLPSFLYLPTDQDRAGGGLGLPWDPAPDAVAGVLARERGALAPGRQVASAKSWLCHPDVDRTARILPWGADDADRACSPVEAAARYLAHLRDAWNHAMEGMMAEALRFERQDLVLTVPASFDEEARELTVEAARQAGLERLTLLEEPQAAFYAWMAAHREHLAGHLRDGDVVLVCDVGGGTTDFSLIRVRIVEGAVQFERTAIGEHLLLGGDNVDLALARRVEEKLGTPRLTLAQRNALRRQCCAAKEALLGDPAIERIPVTVLGGGRGVVGGTLTAELTRAEVVETLAVGFLPLTAADDLPARDRRAGLRELGLPYAADPAITRHLAAFLGRAAGARPGGAGALVRPNAILFNGGFFAAPLARERIVEAVAAWFARDGEGWRPRVLATEAPEHAVAIGAAYYAHVRRTGGLRVRGGSPRAYYIGVQAGGEGESAGGAGIPAMCVLPRGTEEGTRLEFPEREFTVATNQPVAFTLYSSTGPTADPAGALVPLDPEAIHRHAPLVTMLRYGKRSRRADLGIRVQVTYTEVGTLEVWCHSQPTEHRWRLQFQLRGAPPQVRPEGDAAEGAPQTLIPDDAMAAAERLIRGTFGKPGDPGVSPDGLTAQLEAILGYAKQAWPMATIRALCDVLADVAEGRRKSPRHEARWLNLFGFCLRPGIGAAQDPWRMDRARAIYRAGLLHAKDVQCQAEWFVLWQRVAAGFDAGQQHELYQRHLAALGVGGRKREGRIHPHVERQGWRMLASLERLAAPVRVALGNELVRKLRKEPAGGGYAWALGRMGARAPFAGPLNCVAPSQAAEAWVEALLALPEIGPEAAWAVAHIGARTGDPARDIGEELRQKALERLAGAAPDAIAHLREVVPPARADALRLFGESLPEGLRLAGWS